MKKNFIVFIILSVALLFSCQPQKENDEIKDEIKEDIKASYHVNHQSLSRMDYETIYLMCKSFLEEFYAATVYNKTMDLSPYILNNNLCIYTNKKIEKASVSRYSQFSALYGVNSIDWKNIDSNIVYIKIVTEVRNSEIGGFGESHQFIIQNIDGQLFIIDWYSPGKGNSAWLDDIARGQIGKIEDPSVWDNDIWVRNIFLKADIIKDDDL